MSSTHYWIGDSTKYACKCCKTELLINTALVGGQYTMSYEYTYANGDKSTVFSKDISDVCPVEEWDLGKWLPGAVQI